LARARRDEAADAAGSPPNANPFVPQRATSPPSRWPASSNVGANTPVASSTLYACIVLCVLLLSMLDYRVICVPGLLFVFL
jgi:hypothetical protein